MMKNGDAGIFPVYYSLKLQPVVTMYKDIIRNETLQRTLHTKQKRKRQWMVHDTGYSENVPFRKKPQIVKTKSTSSCYTNGAKKKVIIFLSEKDVASEQLSE